MSNRYLQIGILIVLAAAVLFLIPHKSPVPSAEINSYADCVKAGGSVSGGSCTTPDGKCCFTQSPEVNSEVVVTTPQPNAVVTSPLTVSGQALNTWYFEANLPVKLKDGSGNVLAEKGFYAMTDWMTPGFVSFSDTLTFTMPATQTGTLEIHNDNPSGDPAKDKVFSVPVKFW